MKPLTKTGLHALERWMAKRLVILEESRTRYWPMTTQRMTPKQLEYLQRLIEDYKKLLQHADDGWILR